MDHLFEPLVALIALTVMEIVLGIDNIVFIAITADRLPVEQRSQARKLGLLFALGSRIALLSVISWIIQLTNPLFTWTQLGAPESWFIEHKEALDVSVKDLILLGGGLFLIWKTTKEIHHQFEGEEHEHAPKKKVTMASVIAQIAVLDIIFSLDSVITAVGMADKLWVMITAVILAVGVMVIFSDRISDFVSKHPSLKMLALSFLMLIGVMLIAEGIGSHVEKGYVYFAMAFSLLVEVLNMRVRTKQQAVQEMAGADD